eukprot:Gb_20632 [translate_table: standard]
MIMIYSLGHISGAHFNPAITVAFATVRCFPWNHVPGYIAAQVVAAISASYVLRLMFGSVAFIGATYPHGSDMQSFVMEILITFLLMFVVSAVATDTRAANFRSFDEPCKGQLCICCQQGLCHCWQQIHKHLGVHGCARNRFADRCFVLQCHSAER